MTTVGAASPLWVRDALSGPVREVPVLLRTASTVYLDIGTAAIGVLGRDAAEVPCGVRTLWRTLPSMRRPVHRARIGAGGVSLAEHDVRVTRLTDPAVPRLRTVDLQALRTFANALDATRAGPVQDVREQLPPVALRRLADGDPKAVPRLCGLGPGLTPLGDDVVAGWAVARYALGTLPDDMVRAVQAVDRTRTTLLSATLLRCALAGQSVAALRDLLLALHRGSGVLPAIGRLLRVGHTSGAGLATGVRLALCRYADDGSPA